MEIERIMCCCASGLGSSLLIRMNVEKALKNLGMDQIKVSHSALADVKPESADLFVVGGNLEKFTKEFDTVILLSNLMSIPEIEEKLETAFKE